MSKVRFIFGRKINDMKKQIRQGVFETNSSSTHSICIAKEIELIIPKTIHFSFGEFGWECDSFSNASSKASYLYTGLIANGRQSDFDNIISILEGKGIEVTYEKPIYKKYTYNGNDGSEYAENGGYVDHSGELNDFIDAICADVNNLMSYLFSPLSYVVTGNDNDEADVRIDATYPHDEYYKGN